MIIRRSLLHKKLDYQNFHGTNFNETLPTEVCGHVEPADATLGGAAPAIDVPSLSDTKARRRSGTSKLFPQMTYVICHHHKTLCGTTQDK